ncbi:hypothetical protein D3C87_1680550 [compost metagenome]
MAGAEEGGGEVGGKRLLPFGRGDLGKRPHRTDRAGIVDGDVEAAEMPGCGFDQPGMRVFLCDIAADGDRLAALGADGLNHRGERRFGAGVQHHLRAFGGEKLGDRATDARRGAGDDCDLILQHGHGLAPLG